MEENEESKEEVKLEENDAKQEEVKPENDAKQEEAKPEEAKPEENDVKQEEAKPEQNDLKQETVKTFNEAKEQIKNINLKQEAEVGKGLLKNLWKNPIGTIKGIAEDEENKTFKTTLLLVAVWTVIVLINRILYYATAKYVDFSFLSTLKVTITPIIRVIAMTIAIYLINQKSNKSVSKILTSVGVAYIPSMVSSLLSFLTYLSSNISYILSPISSLLYVLSVILIYNTVKALSQEKEDENVLKQFVKVEAIFYVIVFAFSFLGIYL